MWRCRARLPNVLGFFLKFLTTARMLVAGSLLVMGQSSGKLTRVLLPLTSWRRAELLIQSYAKKWITPCCDLAPPALCRLHVVSSDFRPTSVTESGQTPIRGLLPSRAIGGDSMTSDDPAPGSLTVFQSSRALRPQDAPKAPHLGSLLVSSARSYVDSCKQHMPPFLRWRTWKPSWERLAQVSSTVDDTMLVSFASWLKLVPCSFLPSASLKML